MKSKIKIFWDTKLKFSSFLFNLEQLDFERRRCRGDPYYYIYEHGTLLLQ